MPHVCRFLQRPEEGAELLGLQLQHECWELNLGPHFPAPNVLLTSLWAGILCLLEFFCLLVLFLFEYEGFILGLSWATIV